MYKTILADPPWKVSLFSRVVRPQQKEHPYPLMTLDEIKTLPVNEIADEQCHLYLWTTHTFLPKAFSVIESWGFKYNCCLTWDKTFGFTPFGFMWSTEFLLFAQRPGHWLNPKVFAVKTLFTEKSTRHSRKPEISYKIIEAVSYEPRIELFARYKREGWDVWGNEVDSDINLLEDKKVT